MALTTAQRSKNRRANRSPAKAEAERQSARDRYAANKIDVSINHRDWIKQRKIAIFEYYGGCKCVLCHETRLGTLHLDHENGDGADHRRQVGRRGVYKWIIDNNYPSGFRVLCSNCNWKTRPRKILSTSAHAISLRKRAAEARLKILGLLGSKCTECGTTDYEVLTVHHSKNDGAKHRSEISYGLAGHVFYRAVLSSGNTTDLECLCFSCNDCRHVEKLNDVP